MRAEFLRHVAAAFGAVVLIAVMAAIGSPGATYRANAAFASCVAAAPQGSDGENLDGFAACKEAHCPGEEPSRVASLGLWLHGQLDEEAPACHEPPELLEVILP